MNKEKDVILKVENLKKVYNPGTAAAVHALKGISLEIKRGEFVALMGRSGSGKSTFLHQVALLDTPTEGKIFIDGKDVSSMSEDEKSEFRLNFIGYIFQDYALLPELTMYENIALPMIASGADKKEIDAAVSEAVSNVGLEGLESHLPSELSGGQKQRVSIARAIVNKPQILFADEPTANLDSESSKQVLESLKRLNEEFNQTIIMVTHEPEDEQYVDRVLWLKDGLLYNKEDVKTK